MSTWIWVVVGTTVGVTGGYFGYRYWKDQQDAKEVVEPVIEVVAPSLEQVIGQADIYYEPGIVLEETTLNPYSLSMKLDYGPISIYNDDRTIAESARFTYTGWYF